MTVIGWFRARYLFALAVQPLLVLLLSLAVRSDRGPFWQGQISDPDYIYLFSALNISQLRAPHHTDHPGLTVQVPGAAVLRIVEGLDRTLRGDTGGLVARVPEDPERYLRILSNTLLGFAAVSLFLAGLAALRLGLRARVAVALQSSWLFTPLILIHGTRVTPEAVFPILLPWVGLLLVWYGQEREVQWSDRTSVATGILLALLLATKINALPWLALLLLPGSRRHATRVLVSCAAALAILAIPIYPRILHFGKWIFALSYYTGRYGSGDPGVVDPKQSLFALSQYVMLETAVVVAALLLVAALVRRAAGESTMRSGSAWVALWSARRVRTVLVATLAVWGCLALAAKHPAVRYLLPVSGVLPALFLIAFTRWGARRPTGGWPRWAGFLMVALVVRALAGTATEVKNYREERSHSASLARAVAMIDSSCTRIYQYRASAPEYALSFANEYSGRPYSRSIRAARPGRWWTYNIWSKELWADDLQLPMDTLSTLPCVVVQGIPRDALPPLTRTHREVLGASWAKESAVTFRH